MPLKMRIIKVDCKPKICIEWTITMQVKLIWAQPKEFVKNDQKVVGTTLVFLNEKSGETYRYFVGIDNPKGFKVSQLSEIKGKLLDITSEIKTFNGISRVSLVDIAEAK